MRCRLSLAGWGVPCSCGCGEGAHTGHAQTVGRMQNQTRGREPPRRSTRPSYMVIRGPGEPAMAGGGATVTDGPAGGAPSVGGRGACVPDAESAAGGGAGLVWRTEALQGSHAAGRAQRGAERCFAPTQPEQRDGTAPPQPPCLLHPAPHKPPEPGAGVQGGPQTSAPRLGSPAGRSPRGDGPLRPRPRVPESPSPRRKAARPPGERLRCSGKEQRPRVANRPVRPGPRLNVRQSK